MTEVERRFWGRFDQGDSYKACEKKKHSIGLKRGSKFITLKVNQNNQNILTTSSHARKLVCLYYCVCWIILIQLHLIKTKISWNSYTQVQLNFRTCDLVARIFCMFWFMLRVNQIQINVFWFLTYLLSYL